MVCCKNGDGDAWYVVEIRIDFNFNFERFSVTSARVSLIAPNNPATTLPPLNCSFNVFVTKMSKSKDGLPYLSAIVRSLSFLRLFFFLVSARTVRSFENEEEEE